MNVNKDTPQYNTEYIDKVLKGAREDESTGNHLLLDSLTRIFKHKRRESKHED